MKPADIEALFDQQAEIYDRQWIRMAPLRDALNMLVVALFSDLPADARILCVGAGTGSEILHLAEHFPGFRFTAVEPAGQMLEVCRRRAEAAGITSRCEFHQGYLESLPVTEPFDGATSLLVSQFIVDPDERVAFFRGIGKRLATGGLLASADLCADVTSAAYRNLLDVWLRMMLAADVPPETVERMRVAYSSDVAVLPPDRVTGFMRTAGFEAPIPFFQGGLIHAFFAPRGC